MAISNGSTIDKDDLNDYFNTTLDTLRDPGVYKLPRKQWVQSFHIKGLTSNTAEYLRTVAFYPRTDCTLRAIRLFAYSATSGINLTANIPAQIVEDNVIVGGNIKETITLTAQTQGRYSNTGVINLSLGSSLYELPNNQFFNILAGDNIEIILSSSSATAADATISLVLENEVTNK